MLYMVGYDNSLLSPKHVTISEAQQQLKGDQSIFQTTSEVLQKVQAMLSFFSLQKMYLTFSSVFYGANVNSVGKMANYLTARFCGNFWAHVGIVAVSLHLSLNVYAQLGTQRKQREVAYCFGVSPHPFLHLHFLGQCPLLGLSNPGILSSPPPAAAFPAISESHPELLLSLFLQKTLWQEGRDNRMRAKTKAKLLWKCCFLL